MKFYNIRNMQVATDIKNKKKEGGHFVSLYVLILAFGFFYFLLSFLLFARAGSGRRFFFRFVEPASEDARALLLFALVQRFGALRLRVGQNSLHRLGRARAGGCCFCRRRRSHVRCHFVFRPTAAAAAPTFQGHGSPPASFQGLLPVGVSPFHRVLHQVWVGHDQGRRRRRSSHRRRGRSVYCRRSFRFLCTAAARRCRLVGHG
mmetsp:Transcript_25018/g.50122  ORF Transcript_25018/g.50122 Transcript_25018/m.50122 type:complete len:204 (-) Transcript_25018:19-630(-)